ncbi:hypothetical protein HDU96_003721 [Phlyctochytrium bullatum]|nr:hypothetical protein HDU96_003721 [Phlyctochytrium bullatum]
MSGSSLSRAITLLGRQNLSVLRHHNRRYASTSSPSAIGTRFSRPSTVRSIAVASTTALAASATFSKPLRSEPSSAKAMSTAASAPASRLVEGEVDVPLGTLTYRMRLPPGSTIFDPSKPVLVFFHGILVNALVWDGVMDRVAAHGYQCVALDLPLGCNQYPVKDRSTLNFSTLAKGVEAAIERIGIRNYVIVGNDTGGVVAQKVIQLDLERSERERRITGLIMTPCDCFENFLPPMLQTLIVAARNIPGLFHISVLGSMFYHPFLYNSPILTGWLVKKGLSPVLARQFGDRIRASPAIQADTKQLLYDIRPEVTLEVAKDLHRFKKPTFVITVPEDTVLFSEKFMLRFADALRRPVDEKYVKNEFDGREYGEVHVRRIVDSYAFVQLDQPKVLADLVVEYMKTYFA